MAIGENIRKNKGRRGRNTKERDCEQQERENNYENARFIGLEVIKKRYILDYPVVAWSPIRKTTRKPTNK